MSSLLPQIRRLTSADYAQLAAFLTVTRPHHPPLAAEMQHHDQLSPPDRLRVRLIAEEHGEIVGHASALQYATYPADFYDVMIDVAPQQRRHGLATALYQALCTALRGRGPLLMSAEIREDWPAGLALAQRLGFSEHMRSWESALDVTHCDLSRYSAQRAAVAAAGYRIVTVRDVFAADPDDGPRKLHAALAVLQRDVPRGAPYSHPTFEVWLQHSIETPDLLPEGYFLALLADEIVAVSQLWAFSQPGILLTGLTATRREHQRRGLALALKCTALEYARTAGYREVRTGNASTNDAMIAINDALGFVRYPAWIQLVLPQTL